MVLRPGALRLITLMNTIAKVMAKQADATLSSIASFSAATPQRGFVAGRRIDDNILELSGALHDFSQCGDEVALLLIDFAAAFPSLSRSFMFAVLRAMRLLGALICLTEELYRDLDTAIVLGGADICRIDLASGIQQGCPLFGSLFAVCLDPPLRCYMAKITFRSSGLCAFADDLGAALMQYRTQLPAIIWLLRRWGAASGLYVNAAKMQLVVVGAESAARAFVASLPNFSDIQVFRKAKYLGVHLGPDAP